MKAVPLFLPMLGIVLLIPLFGVFGLAFTSQLVVLLGVSNSWMDTFGAVAEHYKILSMLPFIWLPIAAFVLNALPLALSAIRNGNPFQWQFVTSNFLPIAVAGLAVLGVLFLAGHDFFPCMLNGMIEHGVREISPLFQICKNA